MIDSSARTGDFVVANQYLNPAIPAGTTGRIVDIQWDSDGRIVDVGVSFDVQPSECLHKLSGQISQRTGYWCFAKALDFLEMKGKFGYVSPEDLEELFA